MKDRNQCCSTLKTIIGDPELGFNYYEDVREFSVSEFPKVYSISDNEVFGGIILFFCPFCGRRFPTELSDFRDQTLMKELLVDEDTLDEMWKTKDGIPAEFLTDEWWIKRQNKPAFPHSYPTRKEELEKYAQANDMLFPTKEEQANFVNNALQKEAVEWLEKKGCCCPSLKENYFNLTNKTPTVGTDYRIYYQPEVRRFIFGNMSSWHIQSAFYKTRPTRLFFININYCTWCGAKLPKSLAKEWLDIVRTKFGVQDISEPKELAKIPDKYMSEEWWRELGL